MASRPRWPSGKRIEPQPAFHRRHRDRVLRLSALALRSSGPDLLPNVRTVVKKDTVDEVAARLLALPEGSRWYALFACGDHAGAASLRDHLFELRKKGFTRLFQAGRISSFRRPSRCSISISASRLGAVDRIAIGPGLHQRLVDTVEICYREAGEVIFESAAPPARTLRFNEKFQCKTCGMEFAVAEPILFSFNSPVGACPRCQGSATPSISTWTG